MDISTHRNARRHSWKVCVSLLLLTPVGGISAARATTYDLSAGFSTANTAGQPWFYIYDGGELPFQSAAVSDGNPIQPATVGGYYSTGNDLYVNTPDVIKTAVAGEYAGETALDFGAGDVIVHSPNDGTPVSLEWQAPGAGTVSFTVDVWYAHSLVNRSNDVSVSLDGNTSSATISTTSFYNIDNEWAVLGSSDPVSAGDLLSVDLMKTPGQAYGSLDGVSIDVNFTPTMTAVTEPSTWALMFLGFAGIGFAGYRQRRAARIA